ncbi:hypothetical protein GIB67_018994 [Kingdonia uniflora]|uniref:Uncharacterized protein n=1 Tax=Kingdonia uniflora TaxID=39325 RepID=A0A7J7MGX7_9MAGN|nr:hypothetical protein GIB67_018994 [Kingdonia uniflora]
MTSEDFVTSENATAKDLAVLVDDCWLENHERGISLEDGPTEEVSEVDASKEALACKGAPVMNARKVVVVNASEEVSALVPNLLTMLFCLSVTVVPNLYSQEVKARGAQARGMDDFKDPFKGITKDVNRRKTCYKQDWTTRIYSGFRILAPTTYIFFAFALPDIAFGE